MCDVLGDFELGMECVLSWEEYLLHCASSKGFRVLGLRGCWEIEMIVLADLALNLCPVYEIEPCWSSRVNLCGDYVVGYELSSHIKQPVDS
jgi:hypothetical protein